MRKLTIARNKLSAIIAALVCIILPEVANADTPEMIELQMDEIKLNPSYIYGESFGDNENIAYANALTDLMIYSNEVRLQQGFEQLKSSDLQPVAKELKYSKDGLHTVFLYLPIDTMMKIESKSHSDVVYQNNSESSKSNTTAQNSTPPQPSNTSSNGGFTFVPEKNNDGTQTTISRPSLPSDVLTTLTGQGTWIEIKPFMENYKAAGKIKETGATQQWSSVPEDAYSILLDADAGVLAVFSPMENSKRMNYKTNHPDNFSNYPNCKFIVWYK